VREIKIFEKNNPKISVNVYGLKKGKNRRHIVYPLKVVDEEKKDHFDLLLITNGDKSHYTYISNFSRLIRTQKTEHNDSVVLGKRCFTSYDNRPLKNTLCGQAALDHHKLICESHKPISPQMPGSGSMLEFGAWNKTQRHPIVIYADFEALLVKCNEKKGKNTTVIQNHKPMSYGFFVKVDDHIPKELLEEFEIPTSPVIYRGSNQKKEVAKHFVQSIVEIAEKIDKLLKTIIPIIWTPEQQRLHDACRTCNLCKKGFSKENHKVADHCHLSGKFRQTLCNSCNLKLQQPNFVPVFLHNLTNYDAHFLVTELGYDTNTISVIPNSEEKFISFSKYINNSFTIRFIDTFRFMASSLSTLAKNLITPEFEKFRETTKAFKHNDMNLVTRKGVYLYEFTDSWINLEETHLPKKADFYSTLTEEHI